MPVEWAPLDDGMWEAWGGLRDLPGYFVPVVVIRLRSKESRI